MKAPESLVAIGKFLIHVFAAALGFVVVVLVALGLSKFGHWLEALDELPELIVAIVYGLEWFLFGIDTICFIIVIVIEAWSLVVEIWNIHKEQTG